MFTVSKFNQNYRFQIQKPYVSFQKIRLFFIDLEKNVIKKSNTDHNN